MDGPIYLGIIVISLWTILVLVRAVRVGFTEPSKFELERRAGNGDVAASKMLRSISQLPLLKALQVFVVNILLVLAIAATIYTLGWLTGIIASIFIAILIEKIHRFKKVTACANSLEKKHHVAAVRLAERLKPILQPLVENETDQKSVSFYSKNELAILIDSDSKVLSTKEKSLLKSGLIFSDIKVEEIMTPLADIVAVKDDETVGPLLLDELHKSGHSRFPVIHRDVDHVVGMLLLPDLVSGNKPPATVHAAMRPEVSYIRHDTRLDKALCAFLHTKHHLFIVVNENRKTVGILTLKCILESLVGSTIEGTCDASDNLQTVASKNPK